MLKKVKDISLYLTNKQEVEMGSKASVTPLHQGWAHAVYVLVTQCLISC